MTFVSPNRRSPRALNFCTVAHSGAMAALIGWARTGLGRHTHKLGRLRSAVLMVRFTTAIVALQVLQILMWASFYRHPSSPVEIFLLFSSFSKNSTVALRDSACCSNSSGDQQSVPGRALMCSFRDRRAHLDALGCSRLLIIRASSSLESKYGKPD